MVDSVSSPGLFFLALAILNTYPLAVAPSEASSASTATRTSRSGVSPGSRISCGRVRTGSSTETSSTPRPATLAYSDAILLPAIVVSPLHWLGVDPIVVYNLVLIAAFTLNGLAAYSPRPLPDRVDGRRSRRRQHLRLLAAPLRPLRPPRDAVRLLDPVGRARLAQGDRARVRSRGYLRVAALVAAQVLSCIYYGVFLITWLGVVTAFRFWRTPSRSAEGRRADAGAAAHRPGDLFDSLPAQPREGRRPARTNDVKVYSATAQRFPQHAGNESALWLVRAAGRSRTAPVSRACRGRPAGCRALAAGEPHGGGAHRRPDRGARADVRLQRPRLQVSLRWVLPFRGLRVPARAYVLVLLGIAVIAGVGMARLTAVSLSRVTMAPGAVSTVAWCHRDRPGRARRDRILHRSAVARKSIARSRSGIRGSRSVDDAVVFEWPVTVPWRLYDMVDLTYMARSTIHWRPMLNGYSGFYPRSYLRLLLDMRSFPDTRSLNILRQRGATILVLHEVRGTRPSYPRAVERLMRDPYVEADRAGPRRTAGASRSSGCCRGPTPASSGTAQPQARR